MAVPILDYLYTLVSPSEGETWVGGGDTHEFTLLGTDSLTERMKG